MRLILVFILCLFSAPKVLLAQDKQAKTVEEAAEEKEAYQRLQDSIFKKLKTVIATYPIKQQRTFLKDLLKEYPKEKKEKVIPEGWMDKGKVGVLVNQSAFNAEWSSGGSNNISGNVILSYDLNYKSKRISWDNQFRFSYGLSKLEDSDFFRKTVDNLEYNSVLGAKATKNWYYSAFTNLKTQLDVGYRYNKEGDEREETSRGFSPAYIQLGLGGLWKKDNDNWVNIAPLAGRLIYVHGRFTEENAVFWW